MKVHLQPGDEIEALCVLRASAEGELSFEGISEAAEGKSYATWVPDDSPEDGHWYEVEFDPESGHYCYDNEAPLD